MFVHCCLHMYVADVATFRLLSDSFVTVDRAFFRHAFTLLEYMNSVVVQNWPGKASFFCSHFYTSLLSHLCTAKSFWPGLAAPFLTIRRHSIIQEISHLLMNPTVHYRDHNSPPLDHITRLISPVSKLTLKLCNSPFLFSQLQVWFSSSSSGFWTAVLYGFCISNTCTSHITILM